MSTECKRESRTVDNTTAENGLMGLIMQVPAEATEEAPEEETVAQEQSDEDDAESATETDTDEAEETEEAEEAGDAVQMFTVKVDGREQQVPLDELLRGYSGQAFIQKGMREVADTKKQVEAERADIQAHRQQLVQIAELLQTGNMPLQPPTPPDERLRQTDPFAHMEQTTAYLMQLQQYQNAQAAMQELQSRTVAEQIAQHEAYRAEQYQLLLQSIPTLADPEKKAKVESTMKEVGQNYYGFSEEEIRSLTDARMYRVLHDAAQFRRIMEGKAAPVPSQKPKTAVVKPGAKASGNSANRVAAREARAKAMSTGDLTSYLLTPS